MARADRVLEIHAVVTEQQSLLPLLEYSGHKRMQSYLNCSLLRPARLVLPAGRVLFRVSINVVVIANAALIGEFKFLNTL